VETIDLLRAVYEGGKFRLLEPSQVELNEGEQVQITVETEPAPNDILALAERVYADLSEEDKDDVERIALERGTFFSERES
jgi:predicted DNA-binding antitoxin AbrB/MazE fold protein